MPKKSPRKKPSNFALDADELGVLINALNYVCNGVALAEFTTVIGTTRRKALKILDKLDAKRS